jgi:hypothetical protein
MTASTHELKRTDILAMAQQAKLMIPDGDVCYLNDMATDKELIAFVRLLESTLMRCVRPCEDTTPQSGVLD